MGNYSIYVTDEFEKRLGKLSKENQKFIDKKFKNFVVPFLKLEPHFGNNIKKLKGYEYDTYRYRIGKFRLFYIIDEEKKNIAIVSISDRKDTYKYPAS